MLAVGVAVILVAVLALVPVALVWRDRRSGYRAAAVHGGSAAERLVTGLTSAAGFASRLSSSASLVIALTGFILPRAGVPVESDPEKFVASDSPVLRDLHRLRDDRRHLGRHRRHGRGRRRPACRRPALDGGVRGPRARASGDAGHLLPRCDRERGRGCCRARSSSPSAPSSPCLSSSATTRSAAVAGLPRMPSPPRRSRSAGPSPHRGSPSPAGSRRSRLSGFPLLSSFGTVVAVNIIAAMLCALVILPPLLRHAGAIQLPRTTGRHLCTGRSRTLHASTQETP